MRPLRPALVLAAAALALAACGSTATVQPNVPASTPASSPASSGPSAAPMGPEGMLLEEGTPLGDLSKAATGATVDGVQCSASEQVAYHIHTHLAVYVDGQLRPVTPGIGIVQPIAQQTAQGAFYGASRCYYWLHVHAQDGVIHVESPTQATYTLGQVFAIWGLPLSTTQVGPATGTEAVFVDGTPFTGDPATIPLGSREDVQIDVGTAVPFQPVDWSQSQL